MKGRSVLVAPFLFLAGFFGPLYQISWVRRDRPYNECYLLRRLVGRWHGDNFEVR